MLRDKPSCPDCGLTLMGAEAANYPEHGYGDCAPGCWCYGTCWAGSEGTCWTICETCKIALDGCPHGRGGLRITRKFGQAVWVGDARIVIRPGPSPNQVRIQIQAPTTTVIQREEIRHRGTP